MLGERTHHWTTNDTMEQQVRGALVRAGNVFENHWLDERERGEFLPQMVETIPGQYDATHGIDIFAVDFKHRLWIIEVTRGTPRGAGLFKGGGKPVKYAGGELQMSAAWRRQATFRFLDQMPDACDKVRDLLHLPAGEDDRLVKIRFLRMPQDHRKAVILPEGGHFDVDRNGYRFQHRGVHAPLERAPIRR